MLDSMGISAVVVATVSADIESRSNPSYRDSISADTVASTTAEIPILRQGFVVVGMFLWFSSYFCSRYPLPPCLLGLCALTH